MIIEKVTDGINGAAVTSTVGTFGGQILFDGCRAGCVKSFVGGAVTAEDLMKKILHRCVIDSILQQYASGVGASSKTGKTGCVVGPKAGLVGDFMAGNKRFYIGGHAEIQWCLAGEWVKVPGDSHKVDQGGKERWLYTGVSD